MSTEQQNQSEDRFHNSPEAGHLTPEERRYLDAARTAWASIRKTFDLWVAVGRGIQALRDRADKLGGRQTFKRLMEQEGLADLDKATVTRLLQIMERHDEVAAWHATLTPKQRLTWSSPSAVFKHCPVFKPQPRDVEKVAPPAIDKARRIPLTIRELLAAAAAECEYDELKAVYAECLQAVRESEQTAKAFTPTDEQPETAQEAVQPEPAADKPAPAPKRPRKAAAAKPVQDPARLARIAALANQALEDPSTLTPKPARKPRKAAASKLANNDVKALARELTGIANGTIKADFGFDPPKSPAQLRKGG